MKILLDVNTFILRLHKERVEWQLVLLDIIDKICMFISVYLGNHECANKETIEKNILAKSFNFLHFSHITVYDGLSPVSPLKLGQANVNRFNDMMILD